MKVLGLFLCSLFHLGLVMGQDEPPAFSYKPYFDTGHSGQKHISLKTGLPNVGDATRVCSSFCSLKATCDAFYHHAQSDGRDCHIVDYELERLNGKVAMARTLYEKVPESISASAAFDAVNGDNAPNLQPCDDDDATLAATECSALPQQEVTYYQCQNVASATFDETVALVSDAKCADEDRLIECELEGDEAISVPQFSFASALAKTAIDANGFSGTLTYVEFPLTHSAAAAKMVRRVVVRSVGAAVSLFLIVVPEFDYAVDGLGVVLVEMGADDCAAAVNLAPMEQAARATSIRIQPEPTAIGWTLKLDIFVKKE